MDNVIIYMNIYIYIYIYIYCAYQDLLKRVTMTILGEFTKVIVRTGRKTVHMYQEFDCAGISFR